MTGAARASQQTRRIRQGQTLYWKRPLERSIGGDAARP